MIRFHWSCKQRNCIERSGAKLAGSRSVVFDAVSRSGNRFDWKPRPCKRSLRVLKSFHRFRHTGPSWLGTEPVRRKINKCNQNTAAEIFLFPRPKGSGHALEQNDCSIFVTKHVLHTNEEATLGIVSIYNYKWRRDVNEIMLGITYIWLCKDEISLL